MNNVAMAKAYIVQAIERIRHSEEAMERGNYPYVVGQCQEAVELLLKDEESGLPPSELYDKEDAEEALRWANHVLQVTSKLFEELVGSEVR